MPHPAWFFVLAVFSFIIFMLETTTTRLSGVFGWLLVAILSFYIGVMAIDGGYRGGQVDALTGKVKYHLVTNDASEVSWELISK